MSRVPVSAGAPARDRLRVHAQPEADQPLAERVGAHQILYRGRALRIDRHDIADLLD